MIVTNKSIPRRTVLRGLGAALALPFLDSMVPAFAARLKARADAVRRLGIVYVPNGMEMGRWTPASVGALELTPILQPLAAHRDRLLVLSGLCAEPAKPIQGEGAGDHARAAAAFLTGVKPKKTEGVDIRAGISMDQIAAQYVGRETELASLEIGVESNELLGACDAGYSCAYANTVSWRTPTTPLPMENNPRAVFERMFGDAGTTNREARLAQLQTDRSILDSVKGEIARFHSGLGSGDRRKLAEYLEAIRDVERRIQRAESSDRVNLPPVEQPAGAPDSYEEHARMMFDLLVLAYQADLTRVFTYMMAREVSARSYANIGVPDAHHGLSHHQRNPEKLDKLAKVNTFHVSIFSSFVDKLAATPDGDGTLLDHSTIVYGAGISESNSHIHDDLPVLLAGNGGGRIKSGRHVRYPEGTPVTNLHLTLLDHLGVPSETLGDSTGTLQHLSDVG